MGAPMVTYAFRRRHGNAALAHAGEPRATAQWTRDEFFEQKGSVPKDAEPFFLFQTGEEEPRQGFS